MEHANRVSFLLTGRNALFSDPITRAGGEKCTYMLPTYQALKGIMESVYWKPTITWIIERVRILNPIRTESKGIRPIEYNTGGNQLSIYTYLRDVAYQVECRFVWNEHRPELTKDRDENKHHSIAKRMIERGGRRDIFLGTRECQGYVEPCVFGEGSGYYDEGGELSLGLQFHGFTYPDETPDHMLYARFWRPVVRNGVVEFCLPEACPVTRAIKPGKSRSFILGETVSPCEELFREVEP